MPSPRLLLSIVALVLVASRSLPAAEFGADENVMSPENVYAFALELEEGGDFARAATEYHRYVSYARARPALDFPRLEEVMFRHAMALARSREYDRALQAFASFGERFPGSEWIPAAMLRLGEIYEEAGAPDEAARRYEQLVRFAPGSPHAARAKARLLAQDVVAGREDRARERLRLADVPFSAQQVRSFEEGIEQAEALPEKSPVLAGFMSALLPGSGHLYAGRPRDALVAFVSNALLIAGTVQAFEEDMPALGAAVGLIELGWYSGTVFSSVNVVKRYNDDLRRDHAERLIRSVHLSRHDDGLGLVYRQRF